MRVQQLKYILKVAEVGSITEAAKLLFISQPSLSNSIKETEKEAGITIFLRSRTGITLTKDGAEFLGYARQVIQQMELLEDRYVTNLPGKVTFGVSSQHYTFTENAFVELVKHFGQERYAFYYNAAVYSVASGSISSQKGLMIVLFNKTIVKLDEYERSMESSSDTLGRVIHESDKFKFVKIKRIKK